MKKTAMQFSGKLYEVKRQYPAIKEFVKRMDTVKKEINKYGERGN